MRFKVYVPLLAVGAGLLAFAAPAEAQVKVKLEPYVTGVNSPLVMVSPPGDARKFVVEQWGRIRIIDADGKLAGEPFLDIRDKIVDAVGRFRRARHARPRLPSGLRHQRQVLRCLQRANQLPERSRQAVLVGPHQRRRRIHRLQGRSGQGGPRIRAAHQLDRLAAVQP